MEIEDYFFGECETNKSGMIYALIIYDITDNKRRLKLAKMLKGYGNRVQKSGFEIHVSKAKYEKLLKKISQYCGDSDSIRLYKINAQSEVKKWGVDLSQEYEEVIVI